MKSYIIGPVPSRRLGRSLGIDLVPAKTCTYDCIYCQIMINTTIKTLKRKEWVPFDDVLKQIRDKIFCKPDIITITGCGEPTLFSRLGELIKKIKGMTDTKICVLTNGSLLWMPEFRKELIHADIVMPNLDAGDESTYQKVNRPHRDISFDVMVEGLISFRKAYKQQYWLEVFLLESITANDSQIEKMVKIADRISPDRIQLNTVTRPTQKYCPSAVSKEKMEYYAELFGNRAEVIANYSKVHKRKDFPVSKEELLNLLKRQPCTIEDISTNFGLNRMEVIKLIEGLCFEEEIKSEKKNGLLYYWF